MTKKLVRRLVNLYDDIESDRPYSKAKVVCFIIYKNKIISFGVNSEKTSQFQYFMRRQAKVNDNDFVYDKTHAEIAAIKKIHPCFNDWRHVELFIISKLKNGKFRYSRPCPICEQAILNKGIRNIYYFNEGGAIIKEFYMKEI